MLRSFSVPLSNYEIVRVGKMFCSYTTKTIISATLVMPPFGGGFILIWGAIRLLYVLSSFEIVEVISLTLYGKSLCSLCSLLIFLARLQKLFIFERFMTRDY